MRKIVSVSITVMMFCFAIYTSLFEDSINADAPEYEIAIETVEQTSIIPNISTEPVTVQEITVEETTVAETTIVETTTEEMTTKKASKRKKEVETTTRPISSTYNSNSNNYYNIPNSSDNKTKNNPEKTTKPKKEKIEHWDSHEERIKEWNSGKSGKERLE